MRAINSTIDRPTMVDAWSATRRWTLTGSGNLRRVVDTPGHVFVINERPNEVRALYQSAEDNRWITIAVTKSVAEAKAALLNCAVEADVEWR